MDDRTSLAEVKAQVQAFTESRGWLKAHSPKNLAMSIAIESAELMEIFQWSDVQESWEVRNGNEWEHTQEELADVLIYCISLANQLDMDLGAAIADKMEKNGRRYPGKE